MLDNVIGIGPVKFNSFKNLVQEMFLSSVELLHFLSFDGENM